MKELSLDAKKTCLTTRLSAFLPVTLAHVEMEVPVL